MQPGLDLLEACGFQASRGRAGVGVVLVILPAHEIVPETLYFHRLVSCSRGVGNVALAATLGHEASIRFQGPRQVREEAVVVRYPMERCGGEDQIHRLLDLER